MLKYWLATDRKTGFSLIEVLMVISIITLISSIIFSQVLGARKKGRDARRMQDLQEINKAISLYVSDNGHAPDIALASNGFPEWNALGAALEPYLKVMPRDPLAPSANYGSFGSEGDPGPYYYTYAGPDIVADYASCMGACDESDYMLRQSAFETRSGCFYFGAKDNYCGEEE